MEQIRIIKTENDIFKILNLNNNSFTYINLHEIENLSLNSLDKVIDDLELRVKYFSRIKSMLLEIKNVDDNLILNLT